MKYKNHTITKTKCSTDVRREAFGHGYWSVEDIYTIDGPVIEVGITSRLTTITDCKEVINHATEERKGDL